MIHTLELPWGFTHPGVQYWKDHKIHVFRGAILPPELRPYASEDFSYSRWREDELNGMVMPPEKSPVTFTPREHQLAAAKRIVHAYQSGARGFLEADKTGLGKGLASSTPIPTPRGFTTMGDLVVGDLVLGANGQPTKVVAKYESKAARFYRITFSDGSTLDADEDHRWLTHNASNVAVERTPLNIPIDGLFGLRQTALRAQTNMAPLSPEDCAMVLENRHLAELDRLLGALPSHGGLIHPQEMLEMLDSWDSDHGERVVTTEEIRQTLQNSAGLPNHSIRPALDDQGQPMGALRHITSVVEIGKSEPYFCISVDSPDHLYLAGLSHIPTHNTLATLSGVTALAKQRGFGVRNKAKLLIVCPKGVIPQWRQTLHNYPVSTALMRPMVINYQQLNKLLEAPSTARVAKKARTKNRQTSQKGKPSVNWDFIIFDEAHYLKNYPSSTMSVAASNLAQLNRPYRKDVSPFVVYSTATPGASPLNFAIMAGIVAPLLVDGPGGRVVTPETWGAFLMKQGFAVTEGKVGYTWASVPWFGKNSDDPRERKKYELALAKSKEVQRKDAQRIGRGLVKPDAPFIMRSPKDIAGWPEQQTIPFPIALDTKQRPIYEEAWTRFRNWLRLTPAKSDPKGALVETLRYRQKSSLLKVDAMADNVVDMVEAGNQVYISCEFMETVDRYREILEKRKVRVAEITGRTESEREAQRLMFQRGQADVVLCSVVAGISVHSGEILPDGTRATSAPRETIIHDIRQNNLDTEQALGRAHRDGQNSRAYFPFLEGTVDESVISSHTNKTANMRTMTGSSKEEADSMENLFREAAAHTTPPNRLS